MPMKTTGLLFLAILSAMTPLIASTPSAPAPDADYVPVRIRQKTNAVYPLRLLYEGVVRGEATAVLEIDSTGRVVDQLITAYTHREFAEEMKRAISRWTFEPGTVNGEPVVSILTLTFDFSVDGVVTYEKRFPSLRDETFGDRFAYFPRGSESLDSKPVGVSMEPPVYPKAWIDEGRSGSVTIRFFIDETGAARLPVIIAHSDTALANAAVAAVKQWKFEPPRVHGKPVLALAEQTFVFEPPATAGNKS